MKSWIVLLTPLAVACGTVNEAPQELTALATLDEPRIDVELTHEDSGTTEGPPVADEVVVVATVAEPVLEVVSNAERHVFRLRHGETLHHFAKWSGGTVEDVVSSSGIELREDYDAGTEIVLNLEQDAKSRVDERREAHRVARASRYIEQRGGESTTAFHTVASGESAWNIARQTIGIPVWLLESYNPSVDLDRLRPGQVLMFPQIAPEPQVAHGEDLLALQ